MTPIPRESTNGNGKEIYEESGLLDTPQMGDSECRHSSCSYKAKWCLNAFRSFFPILQWLPNYSIKENLFNDIVGGLTVGIMHVPQGIAYSSLAGVRPINGLYTSLFAPFIYMFLGTSRHVSLGVFAVVSLMSGACNVRMTDMHFAELPLNLTEDLETEARLDYGITVVATLAFLVGLIQIAMGITRLDSLIELLSDQVINGFMVGASVHVFVAQMDKILGVSLPRHVGIGKIFMHIIDIARAFIELRINLYTTGLSLLAMLILFSVKTWLDPFIKKLTPLPLPYDLVMMILGTVLSFVFDFHGRFHIKVIGVIPTGLPSLSVPEFKLMTSIVVDAISIAVVILVVTISMAKLYAKKHEYKLDVRQEFYALGIMECLCSFLPVWPSSTALARTLVYEAAGTKTQLATLFSSALLLCVIFWLGQFLQLLPVCLLSCIIIVALKGMFLKLGDLPAQWRISPIDTAIFVITFLATVGINIIEGLVVGLIFSVFNVLMQTKRSRFSDLTTLSEEEADNVPRDYKQRNNTRCVRYDGALFFLNTEQFADHLRSFVTGEGEIGEESSRKTNGVAAESERIAHLVLDLSTLRFVDYSGATALLSAIGLMKSHGVRLFLLSTPEHVMKIVRALPQFEKHNASFIDSIRTVDKNIENDIGNEERIATCT